MSKTSLVRTDSRNSLLSTLTPSASRSSLLSNLTPSASREPSRQVTAPSPLATATSILPKLSLTPQKKSAATPGTPQQQQASPAVSTPGQWQHPRIDEVIKRQNATRFDGSNVRLIVLNMALMGASILAPLLAHATLPRTWLLSTEPYSTYTLYLLRLFFALNITLASLPLLRPQDPCEDIPLTPAQRHYLNLPPMTRPATPQEQEQYVTPPRYSRSATPQSNTSSLRGNASDSPLDSSLRRSTSGSPFGGGQIQQQHRASPFGDSNRRRLSFQSTRSSPLSTSEFDAVGSISTPTKSSKASVGLNSKWLYEKGRGSPRGSVGSGLAGWGGGGSVFS